ncbi:hypothetical protein SAMN04489864_11235 [Pedobacter insulae]|uniref:Uncharacterized protein n=1 Tax=Pedobacter insulae TaxID=414048 RepID=A0A1I3A164_9SPHI|nr:hypothetical protein SAMN04489864_11235 [Pedobacter insulae]
MRFKDGKSGMFSPRRVFIADFGEFDAQYYLL